jgi:uncharacterized RDD family membrane protein YckC
MMKYGSFLSRFVAFIIDVLIISVPIFLIQNNDFRTIFSLVVGTLYIVWMNGKYGATVGKMVMGLRIVKENGKKIDYSDALVREISSYLSTAIIFLGYLWMLGDSKKQTWHDKIAKTVVIKV